MTSKLFQWLLAVLITLGGAASQAAITCSIASNGFTAGYSPAAQNITQTNITVTCTRGLVTDPSSVDYSIAANNGLNPKGVNNQAFNGTSAMRYDAYLDGSCSNHWKGNKTIDGTINFSGTGTFSVTRTYWGCIAAGQTGLTAGTYSDIVTATLNYGAFPQLTALTTFPVTIITPATCALSSAPGTVAFGSYVSFGGALGASTAFGATCSNNLPYTVDVSPIGGTIAGLNYTLVLQSATPVMSGASLNATGTGAQQSYTVNGTMAAGQSGVCAAGVCSGAVPHTLTITY